MERETTGFWILYPNGPYGPGPGPYGPNLEPCVTVTGPYRPVLWLFAPYRPCFKSILRFMGLSFRLTAKQETITRDHLWISWNSTSYIVMLYWWRYKICCVSWKHDGRIQSLKVVDSPFSNFNYPWNEFCEFLLEWLEFCVWQHFKGSLDLSTNLIFK